MINLKAPPFGFQAGIEALINNDSLRLPSLLGESRTVPIYSVNTGDKLYDGYVFTLRTFNPMTYREYITRQINDLIQDTDYAEFFIKDTFDNVHYELGQPKCTSPNWIPVSSASIDRALDTIMPERMEFVVPDITPSFSMDRFQGYYLQEDNCSKKLSSSNLANFNEGLAFSLYILRTAEANGLDSFSLVHTNASNVHGKFGNIPRALRWQETIRTKIEKLSKEELAVSAMLADACICGGTFAMRFAEGDVIQLTREIHDGVYGYGWPVYMTT